MSNQYPFDLDKLWEVTDNGLTFFQDEFMSEISKNKGKVKGFSVRSDDDTGSCHIHKSKKSGLYVFTDFGVTNKGINAIDYVMHRDNCDFKDACATLFSQYNISTENYKPVEPITTFSSNVEEKEGFWNIDFHYNIKSEKFLKTIFPFYTDELLESYNFREVIQYENVGRNKQGNLYKRTIEATDDFPIFGYDMGNFVKIYQPKAPKKDKFLYKHSFIGNKPSLPIYGWDRLFKKVDFDLLVSLHSELKQSKDRKEKETLLNQIKEKKLDSVFIATGGSDGINIASLGYDVIWFNSESETISSEEYYKLSMIAKNIYYIPDLDETGVRQAVFVGMQNIDLKIVWLPSILREKGKKDFRDWITEQKTDPIEKVQAIFKKMLTQALNFRFWEYSDKGAIQFHERKLLHFLEHKNIRVYKDKYISSNTGKEPDGYFIQLENNHIKQIHPSEVKDMVLKWLSNNFHDMKVYNKVVRTNFFNQTTLKALPKFEYKKNHCSRNFQYYFFSNIAVKITKDKIEEYKYSRKLGINLWEDDCIKHHLEIEKPFFEIYQDELNQKRIKLLRNNSNFLKVLINTSRIYWQKDADNTGIDTNPFAINSKNLTDDENYLQELHLLNKMFCVGYLLHQYKIRSQSYLVLGVDFKGGPSVRGSYGGTGKTFLQESLKCMQTFETTSGQSLKNDAFPFDGVTPRTKQVLIDDLSPYQDMRDFYTLVTSSFIANQKGGVKYNIPFEDSPKIGATTNFAPDLNASTTRRLLVYLNSDYYHVMTEDNNYPFSRKISDDFGGKDILVRESSREEWNADYNFMMQCLQFYLSQEKPVEAPIDTLLQKNYLMSMGDSYAKFFRNYFTDNENLNDWVERSVAVSEAKEMLGKKFISAQRFTENLELFCKANQWSLEFKKRRNQIGNSVTHFLITTDQSIIDEKENDFDAENIIDDNTDDIDF